MTQVEPQIQSDLARYLKQVDEARQFSTQLMDGLSDRQINWQPVPGKWSIGENIDHLVIMGAQYLDVIDDMLVSGRAAGRFGDRPVRHGIAFRLIMRWMEPPVRTRVPTPRPFRPAPAHDGEALQQAFLSLQDYLEARIQSADGLDLNRIRASSPVISLVRMSLGHWLAFILAHQRRHLWAAFQVKEHELFPPG